MNNLIVRKSISGRSAFVCDEGVRTSSGECRAGAEKPRPGSGRDEADALRGRPVSSA
ncbi:hypothetical protein [Streptomyces azureus]|uniref:hypothetical protein n=1 Tax=Streptomyces azureus TaxID=146537 RepID=UPI001431BC90|nr:hypothetical protein [Streptomyces azureus]